MSYLLPVWAASLSFLAIAGEAYWTAIIVAGLGYLWTLGSSVNNVEPR
jgi:hypothetical protein